MLYKTEQLFYKTFELDPIHEVFDGHLIPIYTVTDEQYLRLIFLLCQPHIDSICDIRLNEDSNLDELREKILQAIIHLYDMDYIKKEQVVELF